MTETETEQLFEFKSNTINLTFNNLPDDIMSKYDKNPKILNKLNITEDTHLVAEINSMIKDISMDMVSFIINECGYITADKEFKSNLLKTAKAFADKHQIK
jgi:hypothetical protein